METEKIPTLEMKKINDAIDMEIFRKEKEQSVAEEEEAADAEEQTPAKEQVVIW